MRLSKSTLGEEKAAAVGLVVVANMRILTSKSTLTAKMVSDAPACLHNARSTDNDSVGEFNVKPRKKDKDMWTEVTKDLVLREAIEQMGYSCEETEDFFYVMEYLKYVRSSPPA
jgi:hypothetical protein